MPRCTYRHKDFANEDVYRGDGTAQCWLDKVGNFGTAEAPDFRCIFHAPTDLKPIDRRDWPLAERGACQAERLKALLEEWNAINAKRSVQNQKSLAFALPGLSCGKLDLQTFIFSSDFICTDATFTGEAIFWGTTFTGGDTNFSGSTFIVDAGFAGSTFIGDAGFESVTFTGEARFGSATFNGKAVFQLATFTGEAVFWKTTFTGDAWFSLATFNRYANFGSATFTGEAMFRSATFTGEAGFERAMFRWDAEFVAATFNRNAEFGFAMFTGKGNAKFDRATFIGDANFAEASFTGNVSFKSVAFSGKAVFFEIIFMGQLFLENCQFANPSSFTKCLIHDLRYDVHTGERVVFNQCKSPQVDIRRPGVWDFTNQDCSLLSFLNMDLSQADFIGANLNDTRFDSCIWPCGLNGYAKVYRHEEILAHSNRSQLPLLQALYRQLKKNLEDVRNYRQAGDFHYREMEVWQRLLQGKWLSLDHAILWLYRSVGDFGENYRKLFASMLLSILLATGLVTVSESLFNGNGIATLIQLFSVLPERFQHGQLGVTLFDLATRLISTFYERLQEVLLGLIPSPFQRKAFDSYSYHFVSKFLVGIEGLVLVTLSVLFVMAMRRRFRR